MVASDILEAPNQGSKTRRNWDGERRRRREGSEAKVLSRCSAKNAGRSASRFVKYHDPIDRTGKEVGHRWRFERGEIRGRGAWWWAAQSRVWVLNRTRSSRKMVTWRHGTRNKWMGPIRIIISINYNQTFLIAIHKILSSIYFHSSYLFRNNKKERKKDLCVVY